MADVLIVDDDPGVLALLEVIVGRVGHDVRSASNAEDALFASAQRRPDLLLLDISLPGRDGDELVELLVRGIGRPRSLVFVSALPPGRVRELAQKYDARWIHKPFEVEDFERVVAESLADAGAEALLNAIDGATDDAPPGPAPGGPNGEDAGPGHGEEPGGATT